MTTKYRDSAPLTITPPRPIPQQQTHTEGINIFYLFEVTIQSTDDRELSMKMGDEILSKLLDKSDVLELDEDTLAEHLLFINNVTLTYEKDTFSGNSVKISDCRAFY